MMLDDIVLYASFFTSFHLPLMDEVMDSQGIHETQRIPWLSVCMDFARRMHPIGVDLNVI